LDLIKLNVHPSAIVRALQKVNIILKKPSLN